MDGSWGAWDLRVGPPEKKRRKKKKDSRGFTVVFNADAKLYQVVISIYRGDTTNATSSVA